MAQKTKTDVLHDLLPKNFKTRQNPNWKAIVKAIGESDQDVADLLEEVRKQFSVKTAARPYVDRLAANVAVTRPDLMGMPDSTFKQFVPVMAYQPKQVKAVIDQLLDVFFFKETISAFTQTDAIEPYRIEDEWELTYLVDGIYEESIIFAAADFADFTSATADEIVSVINRRATYSFAATVYNPILKTKTVRLFTKTIGSKGSVQITGGRVNISMQFSGYNHVSGSGVDTTWDITRIGDEVTFEYISGTSPQLHLIQAGDTVILSMANTVSPVNAGSFPIQSVSVSNNTFTFIDPSGQTGSYDHASIANSYVRFFTPEKAVIYTRPLRAISWEVKPGEIVVEVPATPPTDRPHLIGAARINGLVSEVTDTPSLTQLIISNAGDWPVAGGKFVLQSKDEIQHHIKTISEDLVTSLTFNSRFDKQKIYQYTSKTGSTLSGITPNLPAVSAVYESVITTATRSSDVVTVITTAPHGLAVEEPINISSTTMTGGLTVSVDGQFPVLSIIDSTTFTYASLGDDGVATGGQVSIERIGMSDIGSTIYLTTPLLDTGILGPYIWDTNAPFVLSSLTAELDSSIQAGNALRSLQIVAPNSIPDAEGYLIFDLGTDQEEGPVKYLSRLNDGLLEIDSSYVFKKNHAIGAPIIMIRRKGAHIMSGLGTELALYLTNPILVRQILQDLIVQVKSVGIFLNFMVRAPNQSYATLDVYSTGVDPG